jgi:toxin-antitoxin system PIN domain toxin
MIIPDINLLLYAYNPHVPQHAAASRWWESGMNGEELIGLPNEVSLGFIRIATNPRLGAAAVGVDRARQVVETWLALPNVRVLAPPADHFAKVMALVTSAMGAGALISDAVLASYAIENRAVLYTNDADFSRFPKLNSRNPLLDVP